MRIFILSILFCGSVFSKNFIMSEPRSGLNLTLCSLIQILRRPVGKGDMTYSPTNDRLDVSFESNNFFIYREHDALKLAEYINRMEDKLIVLTRNPKELFMKFNPGFGGFKYMDKQRIKKLKDTFFPKYMGRLRFYDSYPSERKLLLYYEDVIADFDASLLKILDFLELEPKYYEEYLEDKKVIVNKVRDSYIEEYKKMGAEFCQSSKGVAKGIFYTKNIDRKILKEIDIVLMRMSPSIYNKYLKRFE